MEKSVQVQVLSRALKVAWLSWLERLVYIEKVGGSNPSATTKIAKQFCIIGKLKRRDSQGGHGGRLKSVKCVFDSHSRHSAAVVQW